MPDPLVKIRAAKADLERHARERAAAETGPTKTGTDETGPTPTEAGAQTTGSAPDTDPAAGVEQVSAVVVRGKAQRNFTDPDARIMQTADGSFHYCYNAQAVVDEDHQVIVATDFAASSVDSPALPTLLAQTVTNTGVVPAQTLADAGYFSKANMEAADRVGTEALIATGRLRHGEQPAHSSADPCTRLPTPVYEIVNAILRGNADPRTGQG